MTRLLAIALALAVPAAPLLADHHEEGMAAASSATVKSGEKKAPAKMKKSKKVKKAAKAAKERWVCPMNDGGESDKPGRCPKCGMDLVKEEKK
jgi:hypothetical protein